MIASALLAGAAALTFAQQTGHEHHAPPPAETQQEDPHAGHEMPEPEEAEPHAGHAMPAQEADPRVGHTMPAQQDAVAHTTMDHAAMGPDMPASDIPILPPPPEAGSGPARAAVAIWGEEAMREARNQLKEETSGGTYFFFMADRAELRVDDDGDTSYLWDVQGWYGGDIDKFWFKSEGEGEFGEKIESADVEALWSRAFAPFFDYQVGLRQDLTGPQRTYLAAGVQGLAPYLFEVDATAYLSNEGDLTATFEGELDQRITQRLILQPRAEVELAAQDVRELGIGAGLSSIEAGLRLRYEITREFAPYIGIAQEWKIGNAAGLARTEGEDVSATRAVAGVRFWF